MYWALTAKEAGAYLVPRGMLNPNAKIPTHLALYSVP